MTKTLQDIVFFRLSTDRALWARFKAKARDDGRKLNWLIVELIKRYVERGLG